MDTVYDYRKCFWAVPLAILLNIDCLRMETEGRLDGDLNYFFLNSFFDVQTYDGAGHSVLVLSFMSMSFILIFSILCGMDIYKEMFSSGIYVITRVKSRKKWVLSLIGGLGKKSLLFSFLYAVTTLVLQKHYTQMGEDKHTVSAFALAVAFLFFTTFFIALAINYLSILANARVGTFGGVAILLLLIFYIIFYDRIPVLGNIFEFRYLDPVYMCNLFYEHSLFIKIVVPCYHTIILLLFSFYFACKVEKIDIKILNEDI